MSKIVNFLSESFGKDLFSQSIKLIKKLGLLYENKIEEKSETLHVYSLKINK